MRFKFNFKNNAGINSLFKALIESEILFKILFILTGIGSLIWFLLRVVPKPSRASYPCMRATLPIASSFVIYLLALAGSVLFFRKAVNKIRKKQFWYAASIIIVFVAFSSLALVNNSMQAKADNVVFEEFSDPLGPNAPIGEAKGILPGRVVWVYNENATNENCTNDDFDDAYWLDKNCDQSVVDQMFSDGILSVSGEANHADAWNAIFRYFNNNHGKGDVGYTSGETIFIKINAVTAHGGAPSNGNQPVYKEIEYDTSPQTILAMLRQLVNEANVPETNIYIGDPMCDIFNHIYNVLHDEFSEVNYVSSKGLNNRYSLTESTEVGLTFSDNGSVITEISSHKFYVEMMDADYLLNIPTMKGHEWGGVTFFAKNHFGSNSAGQSWEMHPGLVNNDNKGALRSEYNLHYRVLVDLMASQYLGGNTLLFFMDALWATSYEHQKPQKFIKYPWNNDWCSSLLFSLDHVAIESVCIDIMQKEFNVNDSSSSANPPREVYVQYGGVDDHLHQAASSDYWPAGITYDPDNSGSAIPSLGTHEHWNDTVNMQYSRNLGTGDGIELVKIWSEISGIDDIKNFDKISIHPNPCIDFAILHFDFNEPAELSIYIFNANGQKVYDKNFGQVHAGQNEVSLSVNHLNTGLYFCTVKRDNGSGYTQKLIVQ